MTALLGWAVALGSSLTLLPITGRVLLRRDSNGVSPTTAAVASLAMVAWSGYTLSLRDWPALVSSLGPLAIWTTLLAALVVLRKDRLSVACLVVTIVVGVLMFIFVPANILGVIAVGGSVIWSIPQLRTAFKHDSLTGVSATGYFLVFVENLGWGLYGIASGHLAYAVAPIIQGPAALAIAYRARRSQALITVTA